MDDVASSDGPDGPSPSLLYVIGRLDRAVRVQLSEALAPHGLTVSQFTALSILAHRPGLSNAQLARRAFILPQSMIQVVAALESSGLVVRSPARGRTLNTRLTADGRRTLADAETAARRVQDEMVGELDPEVVEATIELLRGFSEALGAAVGSARATDPIPTQDARSSS